MDTFLYSGEEVGRYLSPLDTVQNCVILSVNGLVKYYC